MLVYYPGITDSEPACPLQSTVEVQIPVTAGAVTTIASESRFTEQTLQELSATHQSELMADSGRVSIAAGFATRDDASILAIGDQSGFFEVPHEYWRNEVEWLNAPPDGVRVLPELYAEAAREMFDVSISSKQAVYGVSFPVPVASIYEAGVRPVFSVLEFAGLLMKLNIFDERESVLYAVDREATQKSAFDVGDAVYNVDADTVRGDIRGVETYIDNARARLTSDRYVDEYSVFEIISQFHD